MNKVLGSRNTLLQFQFTHYNNLILITSYFIVIIAHYNFNLQKISFNKNKFKGLIFNLIYSFNRNKNTFYPNLFSNID